MLRLVRNKAGAELRQHAEVEARVRQLEPQRIFPVNPPAHRIGGLPVTEMLQELKHRNQRQTPGSQARLTADGIQRAEVRVLVNEGELITQPRYEGAPGNAARATRAVSAGISPI